MFIRAKRSVQKGVEYEYLQVVESYRDVGKPRQRVIATLGRRDQLVANGTVDGLLRSLSKFSEKLRVVEAVRTRGISAQTSKAWGPALIFRRLWENQGLPELIRQLSRGRKFGFDVDSVTFAMVLQRLCFPGSDLQGSGWVETVEAPGFESIALQHLYRATSFLAETREELERDLFQRDLDLFNQELDLVFLDTTSVYVYRGEESEWRKRGYSRDHRPDLPQFVICVAVDKKGWPISWEIFPGNTADKKAFVEMISKMRKRFRIRRIVVVADRGMISKDTIELLTTHETSAYDYILGCKMRKQKEVSQEVLTRSGRYRKVSPNLKVKEVKVDDRRYIICLNEEEAEKDKIARKAILERLEKKLTEKGAKTLIGNKGFARFLKVERGSVRINPQAVEQDAKYDGKFVLRTNTELPTEEVALTYKGLWRVERTFREQKSTLEVRPVYHHRDDTSIGHIVAGFLALRLEVDLQKRLEDKGIAASWPTLMRDLSQVQAVKVTVDEKQYRLRTNLQGLANQAFVAAGVRPPPPVTPL